MNLGQYLVQQLLEDNIQEVYPKRSSDDINQELVTREESEIERTAEEFNIPIPDIRLAFIAGNMVVLTDTIWSKLENTDSWDVQSLEDAIKLAEKYDKNWKSTLDAIKMEKSIDPPMVLNYDQDKYYLVGGNTRLMFYKALGIIPKVLMATLNLKGPKPFPLKEYSEKIINQLIIKFKQEKPNLGVDIIKSYINRFSQIKDSPRVTEKDIIKYNWKELETTVDANQPKRIKAGKINDGEPSKDANLVYNQNKLRIYVGKTKNACIKYGNGYSFCISARGDDNMYYDYRYEQGGTPYFVFDDTKSSEQDENKNFIDPTHLLVVFVYRDPKEDDESAPSFISRSVPDYTITTANNPGEDEYFTFDSIEQKYPRLKGLKNIFKGVEKDPKEKAEYILDTKYNNLLGYINNSYGNIGGKNYQEGFWDKYIFDTIRWANKNIDEFLNNKLEVYDFHGVLKPGLENDYLTNNIRQNRLVKVGDKINVENQKKSFIEEILKPMYDGDKINHNVEDDWNITYKKIDILNPSFKKYLEEVKQLVDKYRNELSKLRLIKETLKEGLDKDILNSFLKFAIKELNLKQLPSKITLSKDVKKARTKHTFGTFAPDSNAIWLYINNRNTADILRTLAHELVHRKQEEDGRLNPNSGETGSEIENEANAQAGILLRKFGEKNPMIYEGLIKEGVYGDYLFGDKKSGVAVGWYKDKLEPDTPTEKKLFNILKKYAASEFSTYSAISLDDFIPVFKQLKQEYPEIVDPKLSSNDYIYRGTSLPKEQIDKLNSEIKDTTYYQQGYIIPDQIYQSKRKVQSWSTSYYVASGFAFTSAKERGGIPVIMRAKVSDADLYFNPKFMDKLSTQSEDETFNIINPIPVDIMMVEFYEDEFEDIEAGYLHNKK